MSWIEILDLIESVSEAFPVYSSTKFVQMVVLRVQNGPAAGVLG